MAPADLGLDLVGLLLRGLLAGAPEVALAGLGPGMASFYYESYEQEHQKWPRPAWGPEWPVSITNLISRSTRSGPGRPEAWNGQCLLRIL